MLMRKIFLLFLIALLIQSCSKKEGFTNQYALNYDSEAEDDDCSCISYIDVVEGTYRITVTSYPRQTSQ